jgi:cytochrome c-type biogenesis protein CcmH/NrfF
MAVTVVPSLGWVEILLWLVPPFVVAVLAMCWVGWVSRDRGEVDRDEAVLRLGAVLEREPRVAHQTSTATPQRSTGVAVRRVGSE